FGVSSVCLLMKLQTDAGQAIRPNDIQQLMAASDQYKFVLNNFIELSKFKDATIDQIHLEVFNLKEEIEKIAEIHKYVANLKDSKIQMTFAFGFPKQIVGDKLKITRIVYNLLSNALKFTAPHSTVNITVEGLVDTWRLTVRDQGNGIPVARIKKLFLPYETEVSAINPEGVGIGLYITKYIADLLSARITVHNEPQGGACFQVEFPMLKELVTG